jgi:anti-sigma-K factor RskA
MNYSTPELRRKLAGEYVVGTLHGLARRRFERLLAEDPALRQEVAIWERRLAPWLLAVPPQPVPARVWTRIQQRLGHLEAPAPARALPWKWLGIGGTAVAAALALFLVFRPAPGPAPAADLAVLSSQKDEPVWIVRRLDERTLEFSGLVAVEVPDDHDLEVWAIPADGPPQSLGVIRRMGNTRGQLLLGEVARDRLARGKALAISLEPAGGSTTGAPTGPVLFKGRLPG